MENEIWKAIPGFDRYEVSNLGLVRTWQAKGGRLLSSPEIKKITVNKSKGRVGRRKVRLWSHSKQKKVKVAQLVLLAFVGPKPGPEYETSHLEGGPLDDRLCNLMWETAEDNRAREIRSGRSQCKRPKVLAKWFNQLPIGTQMEIVADNSVSQKFYQERICHSEQQNKQRAKWRKLGLCPGCGGVREDDKWKRCVKCRDKGRSRYVPKVLKSLLDLSVQCT